jgi:hypothetical protein
MKLAGGGRTDEMSVAAFLEQPGSTRRRLVVDSLHKLLHLTGQTHPFPVLKLRAEVGRERGVRADRLRRVPA